MLRGGPVLCDGDERGKVQAFPTLAGVDTR